MSEPQPGIRIGHEERAAALRALDQHLAAGRLDADEYADRAAAVSVARTQTDLDVLFTDLPRVTRPSEAPRQRERRVPTLVPAGLLAALVPLVVIVLAISLGAWWLFFVMFFVFGCAGGPRRRHYGYYRRWAPR